jgi:sulfate adenylyltransferase
LIPIDERTLADVEMITNGGFSPLTGFLDQKNTQSVLRRLRLANGTLWPIPIVLPVSDSTKKHLKRGATAALTFRKKVLATIRVSDIFLSDKSAEAKAIFGTTSMNHSAAPK